MNRVLRLPTLLILSSLLIVSTLLPVKASAATFNQNNVMDDFIFNDSGSMNAAQIDSWLNSFPSSCISTNRGFSSPDVVGYNPSHGYLYGGNVSAGTVINNAAKAYDLNPKVLLATLQKEQSLVTGSAGCRYETPPNLDPCPEKPYGTVNPCVIACQYAGGCIYIALGYDCPRYCAPRSVGFSKQIIKAAWKLKFVQQRSLGNYNWNIQKPGWNNSDDPQTAYDGYMTEGCFKRNSWSEQICYGGTRPVNSNSVTVHLDTGATASLYSYTPFLSGNQSFFNRYTEWFGSTLACYYSPGDQAPPSLPHGKMSTSTLPGSWTGPGRQGFMYITPNSAGFSVAVMGSSGSGLEWKGVWWNQTNPGINLGNTVFIPADADADGYTDLFYATSTNPTRPGFAMGLMRNTGNGFAYQGTKWTANNLTLGNTKFIPGKWSSEPGQGFAYATQDSSGFSVASMSVNSSNLTWKGVWWAQNNPGINLSNTVFVPTDGDGDGLTDLYYATSTYWNNPGFAMGLMRNTGNGFAYQGTKWTAGGLKLSDTIFIPGNWTGSGNQGFAYATSCGNRGFDLAVMKGVSGGNLEWQGNKWSAYTLPYKSTMFLPADTNADGTTDLFYIVPSSSGFDLALQQSNPDGSFGWRGIWWSSGLKQSTTIFIP